MSYAVKAEPPGVDRKDLDVKIDGSVVSINAKVEPNKELKDGEWVVRRERYRDNCAPYRSNRQCVNRKRMWDGTGGRQGKQRETDRNPRMRLRRIATYLLA